jgi:predicted nucleic acid-binding protein
MDIVIDASAILAVLLNEPERQRIVDATLGFDLLAPESIPFEIGNAISALIKRKAVTLEEGTTVYRSFAAISIRFLRTDILESIVIAGEEGLYAYDAYLLSCAAGFRIPLLTLDRRLSSAARKRGISLMEV